MRFLSPKIRYLGIGLLALLLASSAQARLHVSGTAQDVSDFLDMLEECACKELGLGTDGTVFVASATLATKVRVADVSAVEETWEGTSPSLMTLIDDIISGDFDVNIETGRSQPRTLIDAFGGDGSGTVDLDDLDQLPTTPPPSSPNCSNRCQNIAHFLMEYKRAATNGIPGGPGTGDADFNDSHPVPTNNDPNTGIGAENTHRQEMGQTTSVTDASFTSPTTLELEYSDGSVETWHLDANGNITSIDCP